MSSDSSVDETQDRGALKRTAEHQNESGENSKRLKVRYDHNDTNISQVESGHMNEEIGLNKDMFYHKGGLVNSLHGNVYQLKLQMLFLKRALDENYIFQLGTEVEDADKFDDIVFKYKKKDQTGIYEIRVVQAKHRLNQSIKITASDLLSSKDDDFSLQKYFISYRKIKQNCEFHKSKLKDLIIYTNIDFDHGKLKTASIELDEIEENDNILKVKKSNKSVKRFKLSLPKSHVLYDTLKETSELHILAKTLAQHVLKNIPLKNNGILKEDYYAISNTVLHVNVPNATFRDEFINGENLSPGVGNFRNILRSCLKLENDDEFKNKLCQTKLNISEAYAFDFHLCPLIDDHEGLAKAFANIIINAKTNFITIIRRKGGVIDSNINKFAFHLLVQDDHENGLVRFARGFFDETQRLSGNLEDFRVNLKSILQRHGIEFLILGQYRFKINNFYTCEETLHGNLLYPKTELPDNEIEDAEIEDFFLKLVFAVNQPNEKELGEIIMEEMGQSSQFNLLDANLVSNSFQNQMLDWFKQKRPEKGKEGVWLHAKTGKEFMNSIEQKVGVLICIGINIAYPEKLASYEIRFGNNNIGEKLKSFLSKENTSQKIFHIIAPKKETIFSAINVYGSLEILKQEFEFAQYKKSDSYIFMRINTLLNKKTQQYVLDAFRTNSSYSLLIIDCKPSPIKMSDERLFTQLSDILMNTCKKLIIIANTENSFTDYIEEDLMSCVTTGTDDSSFSDLTEDSKKILLGKQIIFQGRREKVCLSELIDLSDEKAKELIDGEVMVKLLKDKEISIGSKLKDLCEINKYYIKRKFKSVPLSTEDIQKQLEEGSMHSDLFVISGVDSGLKHHHVHAFDDTQSAAEKYNKLRMDGNNCNIHWLESDSNNLTWYQSHGSVANLLPYTLQKNYMNSLCSPRLIEESIFIHGDHHRDKIRIICGSAGIGKSTVLTNMSMELINDPKLWVIRISLNDHTDNLDKLDNNKILKTLAQSTEHVIDFLLNELSVLKGQSHFDKKLFAYSFNNNPNVVFLIDGFDEISPDYTSIVVCLLEALIKYNIKNIFVTTRPNFKQTLEKVFNVFAYFLEPFTKEEQIEYLTKFWAKKIELDNYCTDKLNKYAECTIEQICKCINDNGQVFVSIPLQLMMIAEVFQENIIGMTSERQGCKEFLKSDLDIPKILEDYSLVQLYENFVERKYYDFYLTDKKIKNLTKVSAKKGKRSSKKEYKSFKKENGLLAIKLLFNEGELKQVLSQAEIDEIYDLIEDFTDGEHLKGIIDEIIDGKPHFVHRTFAEYFASFPIADKILATPSITLQSINNALTDISPIFMHSLIEQFEKELECIALKLEKPLLEFILTDSCSNFLKLLIQSNYNDWHKKLDVYLKSPLHYAVECGKSESIEKVLKYADDIHVNQILKHGYFKYPEYEESLLVKFVNLQDINNKTALFYAIQRKKFDMAFELLFKGADINSLTIEYVNALILHMLRYSTDGTSVSVYNDGILRAYANQENKYRQIQEKLFRRAPHIFNTLSLKDQSRVLSFFFVHGRVEVIRDLLETVKDLNERMTVLNSTDNSVTHFDRVLESEHLTDEARLKITKYLLENNGFSIKSHKYKDFSAIQAVLLAAAEFGHIETLKHFINIEKHINLNDIVYRACECNQLTIVKFMHENFKERVNDANGNTALHAACDIHRGVNLAILKYLIDNIDINAQNDDGETPLFMAKRRKKRNVIEYLLSKGAIDETSVVNQVDIHNIPRLHDAITMKQFDLVESLIREGADVNEKDVNGDSPLHLCVSKPFSSEMIRDEIVGLLLQYGAIFDAKNGNHKSPYDLIRNRWHINVSWLLRVLDEIFSCTNLMQVLRKELLGEPGKYWAEWGPYGSGYPDAYDSQNPMLYILNARNNRGKTLVHIAANTNDVEALGELLKFDHEYLTRQKLEPSVYRYRDYKPMDIDSIDFDGNAPIHLAARKGFTIFVSALLEKGAIFNKNDSEGNTPEEIAKSKNHIEIVELIQPTKDLIGALEKGNQFMVEQYTKTGMYINAKNKHGKTPLHLAACYNQQAVQWLLDNDANIKAIDENGDTPLHMAANNDEINIAVLLIKHGAKYDVANNEGDKPLDLARGQTRDLFEKIDTIFKGIQSDNPQAAGTKLKIYDKDTVTAIIRSCDQDGNTLLHHAAQIGDYKIVEFLLENGAIFDSPNLINQTPISCTFAQNIKNLLDTIGKMYSDIKNISEGMKNVSKRVITNVLDHKRKGLLYYATETGDTQIVSTIRSIIGDE